MYCIKCGFKNKDEAIFCANCGNVMTKKPSDAFDQKIPSEENIADENQESGIEATACRTGNGRGFFRSKSGKTRNQRK